MAYGTPETLDDLEAYYTHIRRGRPPSAEQLEAVRRRYEAIGSSSGLREATQAQLATLQGALDATAPGRFSVALGQKHAPPFIEDGVRTLVDDGATRLVGLVLAPHYSGASVGEYHARADVAATELGVPFREIDRWHDLPAWRAFQVRAVRDALAQMPARTKVLFTAHSLPERVLAGDPYPDELAQSAEAIARAAALPEPGGWGIAWQSAGATPEPWRGPDVLTVLRLLAETGRAEGALVCPQGFTSAHLEVRYDLDVEARAVAEEVGLAFARTAMLEDDAAVFAQLAERVREVVDA
jgi:ferrochelatase